jgi:predicted DNA-binding transcriptional regulator AlpA
MTLLRVSRSAFDRMLARKALPEPIHLNARVLRWRADEIDQWVKAGCPAKSEPQKAA